jgi:hypothetical protein
LKQRLVLQFPLLAPFAMGGRWAVRGLDLPSMRFAKHYGQQKTDQQNSDHAGQHHAEWVFSQQKPKALQKGMDVSRYAVQYRFNFPRRSH